MFVAWLYLALLLHLERGRIPTWIAGAAGLLFVALGVRGFGKSRILARRALKCINRARRRTRVRPRQGSREMAENSS